MKETTPADNPWRIDSTPQGDYVVRTKDDGTMEGFGPFNVADADSLAAALNDAARPEARAVAAETALAAAHAAIRRYEGEWGSGERISGPSDARVTTPIWVHAPYDDLDTPQPPEPMTSAEAAAIRAALLDVPDQPNPTTDYGIRGYWGTKPVTCTCGHPWSIHLEIAARPWERGACTSPEPSDTCVAFVPDQPNPGTVGPTWDDQ